MIFSDKFIRRNESYSEFYDHVPAPMFRKIISIEQPVKECTITITAVGFYDLFINGKRVTKGLLSPYVSAPTELVYYDTYTITEELAKGENCIGVLVGTGLQNDVARWNWRFDHAKWRSYVRFAAAIEIMYEDGTQEVIECDESWKTKDSPIIYDSFFLGEHYDARKEVPGWNLASFDDADWDNAQVAERPMGEATQSVAEPIKTQYDLKPVAITSESRGYIYDFGENCAGLATLTIRNTTPGQVVKMTFGEIVRNGVFDDSNIICLDRGLHTMDEMHLQDVYICKGAEEEVYTPTFTYHGFQYVLVEGITQEQAVDSLLVYHVMNSDLKKNAHFECDHDCINALQDMVIRADLANFYYFPTDCPTREKNGWTGDAALSAEQMIINLTVENSMHEWFKNIRKAQHEDGSMSGYVPTPGWFLNYGDPPGPGWDKVLTDIPYLLYLYRGDKKILEDNANAIVKYLNYIVSRKNGNGLIEFGFGDWVQAGIYDPWKPVDCPSTVCNTACAIDIAEKAAEIFTVLNMPERRVFAEIVAATFRKNFSEHLIDWDTCTVLGSCQSSQAMGLYYNFFEGENEKKAVNRLLDFVHEHDDHLSVGVLGGKVIFHVLADYGYPELAFKMITRPDPPSYGHYVEIGATTLWEGFIDENLSLPYSRNHHFWGDISTWFYKYLGGIRIDRRYVNENLVEISPCFIEEMTRVSCYVDTPQGRVSSQWEKADGQVILKISAPVGTNVQINAYKGYQFEDGTDTKIISMPEQIFKTVTLRTL